MSLARSGVVRDWYSRDVVYIPEPEGPGRLSKQLATVLASLAILWGGKATEEDYAYLTVRIAAVLRLIAAAPEYQLT